MGTEINGITPFLIFFPASIRPLLVLLPIKVPLLLLIFILLLTNKIFDVSIWI